MAAGVVIAALGFAVLSLTDPLGRDWASAFSPFLILGGYVLVAFGILSKS